MDDTISPRGTVMSPKNSTRINKIPSQQSDNNILANKDSQIDHRKTEADLNILPNEITSEAVDQFYHSFLLSGDYYKLANQ